MAGSCDTARVRVSARADYAIRAAIELAAAEGAGPVKREAIFEAQQIPVSFLENILLDLKRAGIVQSLRGQEGGYWLARSAGDVSVADVIRAVDGPLVNIRGARPEDVTYAGSAGRCATSGWRPGPTFGRFSRSPPSRTSCPVSCPRRSAGWRLRLVA